MITKIKLHKTASFADVLEIMPKAINLRLMRKIFEKNKKHTITVTTQVVCF